MSAALQRKYPTLVRTLTDHSVASILAHETATDRQLAASLPAANLSTNDDERHQNETTADESSLDPLLYHHRAAPSRFVDFGDGTAADFVRQRIGSFDSLSLVPRAVEHVVAASRGCIAPFSCLCQPRRGHQNSEDDGIDVLQAFGDATGPGDHRGATNECYRLPPNRGRRIPARSVDQATPGSQNNFEDHITDMRRVPLSSVEFQAAGFAPVTSSEDCRVHGADAGHGPGTWNRGMPLRPSPTLPPARIPSGDSPRLSLESADLWRRFDELTTEMVITKAGRSVISELTINAV